MNRILYKRTLSQTNKCLTFLLIVGAAVICFFAMPAEVIAQKRFSKTYPASNAVRLQLTNRSGTITVQGWNRREVKISASLERPIANIEPEVVGGTIVINIVRDNKGRNDVGDTNFNISVPYFSSVDIETRIGNLNVSNIQGGLVRAHISSEGDVTLTNISASNVSAKNVIGNIFYDGLIQPKGRYRFESTNGSINLRIPTDSSFKLIATAPSTRNIALGSFSNTSMRYLGTGRRVTGRAGDGSASLTITNKFGTISFIRR